MAVAVDVFEVAEALAEDGVGGLGDLAEDGGGIRVGCDGCVEDVGAAFASVLTQAYVDDGEVEGGGFHDAAAGVAEQEGGLAEEAPVGDGREIDEEAGVRVAEAEGADAVHQGVAAGVGVGVAEENLVGGVECQVFEGGEECFRFGDGVG